MPRGERGSIDRSILFVGDSLTLQLYEAARCTLPSKYHDALEYYDVEALVDFRRTLARKKRGVVLLNIGLRYGPGEREQLRMQVPLRRTTTAHSLSTMAQFLPTRWMPTRPRSPDWRR